MVYLLHNLPTPQSYWVKVLQIMEPIQHQLYTFYMFLLKPDTTEMFADLHQRAIVFCHVKNEEYTEEVLRPAKKERHQSLLLRNR